MTATTNPTHSQFYVSAINGQKRHLVAGPFDTHQDALDRVDAVRTYAQDNDARACFMAWGTASSDVPLKTPLGTKEV